MTWRDRAVVAVLVAALAAVAAGMLVPPPAAPAQQFEQTSVAPAYREGVLGHPSSVNPLTVRTQTDRDLVALLFRGLVHLGPNGSLLPDIAESWTASNDGRTYTFRLRHDAYWHDGLPITSRDVVYTIGLLHDPEYKGPLGASWRGITVTAAGLDSVRFDLAIPLAGFLQMTTLPLLPEHVVAGTPVAQLADSDFSRHPLGSGPFRLIDLDQKHAVLERVRSITPAPPAFALQTASPPVASAFAVPVQYDTLSDIELRFFDNSTAMAGEFAAGRLDAVGGLPAEDVAVATARPGARLLRYPRTTMAAAVLNLRSGHAKFQNADVRAGLLAAIDRDALVSTEVGGYGSRADVPLLPSSPMFDAGAVKTVAFSPADAEARLVKGGWRTEDNVWYQGDSTDRIAIELVAPDEASNPLAYATGQRVVAAWKGVGIDAKLKALPAAQYLSTIKGADFDAAIVDVDLGLDPDLWPLLYSTETVAGGTNISGYQSSDLDRLLSAARKAVDPAARKTALSKVEAFLSANTPILPLYFQDYTFVVSGAVQNVSIHDMADPSSRYWDVIDWRLASDG